jgi:hypothetical protein
MDHINNDEHHECVLDDCAGIHIDEELEAAATALYDATPSKPEKEWKADIKASKRGYFIEGDD